MGVDCLKGEYNKCESNSEFSEYPQNIQMTLHRFCAKTNKKRKTPVDNTDDAEDNDLNEEEAEEWEEYTETKASTFIQEGKFAVIKTGDDYQYYLLKLTSAPDESQEQTTDGYKNTFLLLHCMAQSATNRVN